MLLSPLLSSPPPTFHTEKYILLPRTSVVAGGSLTGIIDHGHRPQASWTTVGRCEKFQGTITWGANPEYMRLLCFVSCRHLIGYLYLRHGSHGSSFLRFRTVTPPHPNHLLQSLEPNTLTQHKTDESSYNTFNYSSYPTYVSTSAFPSIPPPFFPHILLFPPPPFFLCILHHRIKSSITTNHPPPQNKSTNEKETKKKQDNSLRVRTRLWY